MLQRSGETRWKRRWGIVALLLLASIWIGQGPGLRAYRNLNGMCGQTGQKTNDVQYILSALTQTKHGAWPTSQNSNGQLLEKYPDCCSVRRGYDEERLKSEGVIWELNSYPGRFDRLWGKGYARVTIDPRKIPVKEPYWANKINSVYVYMDTCAGGVDERNDKRQFEG